MTSTIQAREFKDLWDAFDFFYDHVVITDSKENVLYINGAAERITGYALNECIGKKPGQLWGGTMKREFYEEMKQKIYIEKKPFIAEVENTRKDGLKYKQELYISPILNAKGDIEFFLGIEPLIRNRKQELLLKQKFVAHLLKQQETPLETLLDLSSILEEKNMIDD